MHYEHRVCSKGVCSEHPCFFKQMHWVIYRLEVWNTYSEVATSDLQWNAALDQLSCVQFKAHLCNHVV